MGQLIYLHRLTESHLDAHHDHKTSPVGEVLTDRALTRMVREGTVTGPHDVGRPLMPPRDDDVVQRFYRSMGEAFPDERAAAIERPRPGLLMRFIEWLCCALRAAWRHLSS